jgi:hypothetical protein
VIQKRKGNTPGNRDDEATLVKAVLRATGGGDAGQDAAIAILLKQRSGVDIIDPERLSRVIAKRRRSDEKRRTSREVQLKPGPVAATTSGHEGLDACKRRVRAVARAKAERRHWPGEWWIEIGCLLSRCVECGGRGVVATAPLEQWIRHTVRPELRAELRADAILVPPRCIACSATGYGPVLTNADDPGRKKRRKAAKQGLAKAKRRVEAAGKLDGAYADAVFDVMKDRPVVLRRKLVEMLCAQHRVEGPAPAASDLALAALIAGDWPIPAKSDDWRRMTDAEIIEAETRAMRKAHADAGDLVRPLTRRV